MPNARGVPNGRQKVILVKVLMSDLEPFDQKNDPFLKYASDSEKSSDGSGDEEGTGSKFIPGIFKTSAAQKARDKRRKE